MMAQAQAGHRGRAEASVPDKFVASLCTVKQANCSAYSGEVIHISSLALLKVRFGTDLWSDCNSNI